MLRKIDGRYFLFGSHLSLVLVAFFNYRLHITGESMLFAFAAAITTELILHFTFNKYKNSSIFDRSLSAASEAAGLLLLMYSSFSNYYAIISSVAVASKYVFTRANGTHIFNPTNFAIILSLTVIPIRYFSVHSDEYSLFLYPILHVMAFGTFAIYFGKSVGITLSYFATILMCGLMAQFLVPLGFIYIVGPEVGAFGMIFGFLMITDPKTSPRRLSFQILYGVTIALGVLALRFFQICYPQFISLFGVTLVTYALSLRWPQIYLKAPKMEPKVTTKLTKEIPLIASPAS